MIQKQERRRFGGDCNISNIARRSAFFALLIVLLGSATKDAFTQTNPFRVVENLAKLPAGRTWRDPSAVSIDCHGYIWMIDRCGEYPCQVQDLPPILKFSPSGELLKSFGENMFVYAHGLFVDKDDNVWVTDGRGKDGKGFQVFKFNSDGKVLMVLGKAGVPGDGPGTFTGPSAVVVSLKGDIFIADGHKQLPGPCSTVLLNASSRT